MNTHRRPKRTRRNFSCHIWSEKLGVFFDYQLELCMSLGKDARRLLTSENRTLHGTTDVRPRSQNSVHQTDTELEKNKRVVTCFTHGCRSTPWMCTALQGR